MGGSGAERQRKMRWKHKVEDRSFQATQRNRKNMKAALKSITRCKICIFNLTSSRKVALTAPLASRPISNPSSRSFSSTRNLLSHDNPLGLPRNDQRIAPTMPRRSRGGLPEKRKIPNVKRVLVVSSGKGGVGKSTVAG